MAYRFVTPRIGAQPIDEASAVQNHPLGTIVKAVDPELGEGEFIYLEGVANTDAGDWVEYKDDGTTAIASIALNTPDLLAVAMSDCVANMYGWYQISGVAVANKSSATSLPVGAFGVTSGLVVAAESALLVQNGIITTVSSAKDDVTTVNVLISRPAGPISD